LEVLKARDISLALHSCH